MCFELHCNSFTIPLHLPPYFFPLSAPVSPRPASAPFTRRTQRLSRSPSSEKGFSLICIPISLGLQVHNSKRRSSHSLLPFLALSFFILLLAFFLSFSLSLFFSSCFTVVVFGCLWNIFFSFLIYLLFAVHIAYMFHPFSLSSILHLAFLVLFAVSNIC